VEELLAEFSWNAWFLDSYWPENEPRVRLMSRIALERLPDPTAKRALEVGCANGYLAYLFHLLAFDVAAVDAYEDEQRAALFQKARITYHQTNLNEAVPLHEFPDQSFNLVLLGEVFEHILNQPAGLLKEIYRLLRPAGLLILTTPNPSTLANAVRLTRDHYLLWGTGEFLREPKFDGGNVIHRADIHYREYPAWVVRDLLVELGYLIGGITYVRAGVAPTHSFGKRCLKRLLEICGLTRMRLFSPGYVIWATKPA
jgi:SAM-dependent methyltransferase